MHQENILPTGSPSYYWSGLMRSFQLAQARQSCVSTNDSFFKKRLYNGANFIYGIIHILATL